MLQSFVTRLCSELEINMPDFTQPDKTSLPIAGVDLILTNLKPGISFRGVIGACPKIRKEELFIQLMKANYLGQGTGGGKIGLTQDELYLTLSHGLPYEISYHAFREILEDFVNFVLYWRAELEKFETMQKVL